MLRYENECVSCGFPCMGNACPYRRVPYYYCDNCGKEIYEDKVKEIYERHYCIQCWDKLYPEEDKNKEEYESEEY